MSVRRRTFMRLAAAGLSSAFFPLVGCTQPIGQQRPTRHFPTPDEPLTEPGDWYFMAIQGAYLADLDRYRLKIGGVVEEGLTLTDSALRNDFPAALELITLSCVGNTPGGGLLSASLFRGVRLIDLMARARVSSRASGAILLGLDGFVSYQSIEDLKRPESMIAYDMGTSQATLARLPIDHGFPARILTPGLYGYMQPKWIDSITFVDQDGYHDVLHRSIKYAGGKMQLSSGFSAPRGGVVDAGEQLWTGYAFGDGREIASVHVQVDGGPWEPAEIIFNGPQDTDLPPYLWCLFRFRWNATPGRHTLTPRATYVDGETQKEGREFPYSGGSLAHVEAQVREAP